MFYLVGLGLSDEKDITIRGLEAIKSSSRVYLEAYTSILMVPKEKLEIFYGKELILADRDMVETQSDDILRDADKENVSLLVVGDPFGATTHADIIIRARKLNIPTRVIHNASIMNAVSSCGLQLYNFGQTVSLPFFTDTWTPDSWYDRIKQNAQVGLHTLILLDIKVKEQSEENLARGRKIYGPPRYMSISTAIKQILQIEAVRGEKVLDPDTTLVIAMSRIGGIEPATVTGSLTSVGSTSNDQPTVSGILDQPIGGEIQDDDDTSQDVDVAWDPPQNLTSSTQRIVSGTLSSLSRLPPSSFGAPLHSLVVVGRRLHPLEVEYAAEYAKDLEEWKEVAARVYGCTTEGY